MKKNEKKKNKKKIPIEKTEPEQNGKKAVPVEQEKTERKKTNWKLVRELLQGHRRLADKRMYEDKESRRTGR